VYFCLTDFRRICFGIVTELLLYATARAENWTSVEISTRNLVLHLLRIAERCTAGIRSPRTVLEGMEIPRGAEIVV
jgi:hypothetical protein